uniref:Uncharacterized protein n=1 Tax=Mus musculus TaxID=10090 RepID=Q8C3C8_MOUSE|nr:unnamed protein product [Mus musculus]
MNFRKVAMHGAYICTSEKLYHYLEKKQKELLSCIRLLLQWWTKQNVKHKSDVFFFSSKSLNYSIFLKCSVVMYCQRDTSGKQLMKQVTLIMCPSHFPSRSKHLSTPRN